MNTEELLQRICRIQSSIGAVEETDPNKLKAAVIITDKITAVHQDFRGGLNDAELSNLAHMLISNIANLRNHLRTWAVNNGKDNKKVDETFNQSLELRIIQDLSNNDEHGYPPRNGGESRKSPRLIDINSVMQLKTQTKKGSTSGMTLGAGDAPKFFGDATYKAIITGDVVDNKNNHIGDLHKIATKAVEAWGQLWADFGCRN
ncbi:MAG: hypothetical protein ABIL62_20210 [Planctomycetota bacterium]|nr:hypothetical protein [Planctomycetota bacterium]MBU1517713.1 hypothetical protein [Planctomycetota bacterium]MBU2458275.1 hypothetical protein [Planctomycetota bacterium]MBU2596243.1 hypothetical protein [Planctomycetota bacterium]